MQDSDLPPKYSLLECSWWKTFWQLAQKTLCGAVITLFPAAPPTSRLHFNVWKAKKVTHQHPADRQTDRRTDKQVLLVRLRQNVASRGTFEIHMARIHSAGRGPTWESFQITIKGAFHFCFLWCWEVQSPSSGTYTQSDYRRVERWRYSSCLPLDSCVTLTVQRWLRDSNGWWRTSRESNLPSSHLMTFFVYLCDKNTTKLQCTELVTFTSGGTLTQVQFWRHRHFTKLAYFHFVLLNT